MAWRTMLPLFLLLAGPTNAHGTLEERLADAARERAAHPEHSIPWLEGAALHREGGDLEQALLDVDAALARAPGQPAATTLRAQILSDLGRDTEANTVLRALLATHPCHVPALSLQGHLATRSERHLAAATAYDSAIECASVTHPDHHLERARALAAAGASGSAHAIAALETSIAQLGPVPALLEAIIALEIDAGRVDSALAHIDAAIVRAPTSPWWFERRADLLHANGRKREAQGDYLHAHKLLNERPRRGNAYQALGARIQLALQASKDE